jgi:hypothetical protein
VARVRRGLGALDAELAERFIAGDRCGLGEHRIDGDDRSVGEAESGEAVGGVGDDLRHHAVVESHSALFEDEPVGVGNGSGESGEDGDVARVGPQHVRLVHAAHDRAREHRDRPAARLVAVAVRARHDTSPPLLGEAGDVGKSIPDAGRDDEASSGRARAGIGHDLETAGGPAGLDDAGVLDDAVDGTHFAIAVGDQVERRVAVPAEDAVHVRREAVARLRGVEDEDAATGAGQDQRGTQPGGPAADDDDVPVVGRDRAGERGGGRVRHGSSVTRCYSGSNYPCRIGKREPQCPTTHSP